ncbi:MAG: triose-phosphate isomerase [Candidatus Aenigmarchaeota archaeon]|nr:triose-phosphate isomerase [Candidatus Aenigmarchaeota archaeon]
MTMLLVNFKRYDEVMYGGGSLRLAKAAETVSQMYGVEIAVAPPAEHLGIAGEISIPIFAQYVDAANMTAEKIKSFGARGAIINHSDYKIPEGEVLHFVNDARRAGLTSVVCVNSVAEAQAYVSFKPDYMAIEPDNLIGTGKSVSTTRPDAISDLADLLMRHGMEGRAMCGAGISNEDDVRKALEFGAAGGVLVSSAVVKAKDWQGKIEELARGFRG